MRPLKNVTYRTKATLPTVLTEIIDAFNCYINNCALKTSKR